MPVKENKEQKLSPEGELQKWRKEQFVDLGFSSPQATKLALAKDSKGNLTDKYKVAKALAQGCSKELAYRIFS